MPEKTPETSHKDPLKNLRDSTEKMSFNEIFDILDKHKISIDEANETLKINPALTLKHLDKFINVYQSLTFSEIKEVIHKNKDQPIRNIDRQLQIKNSEKTRLNEASLVSKSLEFVSDEKNMEKIKERLPKIRHDISRVEHYMKKIKDDYPEQFEHFFAKYPSMELALTELDKITSYIGSDNEILSDKELFDQFEKYNKFAKYINESMMGVWLKKQEETRTDKLRLMNDETIINENLIDVNDKEKLKLIAREIWEELFPDSHIDSFVKTALGKEKLETYEKILLSPANGIEMAITGASNIINPDFYEDAYNLVSSIPDIDLISDSQAVYESMKFMIKNMDSVDSSTKILQILISLGMLGYGFGKMIKVAKKMGCSAKTLNALRKFEKPFVKGAHRTIFTRKINKAIPIAVMTGIILPYIDIRKL